MLFKNKSIAKKKLIKVKKSWVVVALIGINVLGNLPLKTVNASDNEVLVTNSEELIVALKDKSANRIKLMDNINVKSSEDDLPSHNISFNFNNKNLELGDKHLKFDGGNDSDPMQVTVVNEGKDKADLSHLKNEDNSAVQIKKQVKDESEKAESQNSGSTFNFTLSNGHDKNNNESTNGKETSDQSLKQSSASVLPTESHASTSNSGINLSSLEQINKNSSASHSAVTDVKNSSASAEFVFESSKATVDSNKPVTEVKQQYSSASSSAVSFHSKTAEQSLSNSQFFISNAYIYLAKDDVKAIASSSDSSSRVVKSNSIGSGISSSSALALTNAATNRIFSKQAHENDPFKVDSHKIVVKKKCYIYPDATFDVNKRIRLATNKEISTELISEHAYSKYGRLRYKVKGGYVTANPNYTGEVK